MHHRLCLVLLLAGTYAAGADQTGTLTFDNAGALADWTFHNGPEFPGAKGEINWRSDAGHERPGCLALGHDFTAGGNYVQAVCPAPAGSDPGTVRLWLKKPRDHRVTFRATDSADQTFQKGINYTCPGWQRLDVNLARWDSFFGGPADGVVRYPIKRLGIMIENTAEPKTGELLIDDLTWLPRSAEAAPAGPPTYVASDFTGQPHWSPGGGAGNQLESGAWSFAFNPGTAPSLNTSFSLLGKPIALRLIVDSQAPGTVLLANMAGHFAQFQRQVGVLDGKPGQVIEVPLGDMKSWTRLNEWAGDNVPLPLRMLRLTLQKGQGPQQGRILLKRLEVDTQLPAGLDVLIVPDARIENNQARFTVNLQNLTGADQHGQLVTTFRTLDEYVGAETTPLTLPARGGRQTLEFRRPMQDLPFMDAAFQWIASDRASSSVSIGLAAEMPPVNSSDLDPASPIGMGLYLYRWNGAPNAREHLTRIAQLAQNAGIKWTREEFHWGRIEPRSGQLEWEFYDQMVDVARTHGISVYGLLAYWSSWTKPYTPEGIDDYCRWVRQVVRRYKDRIRHWEVWNEPNIGFWTGPKEMYADLLNKAYDVIKAEDPQAIVFGCSTAGIDKDFIRKTMDLGGRFDALTIHPYRARLDEDDYIRQLQEVRDLVGGRQVWITEIGFPTQLLTGCDERTQAALVARTYLASLASQAVANIAWYDFRNDGHDPFYNEENFGLIRADFRPKPAYRTLATLGRMLAGRRFRERIDLGPGAYAVRFGHDHQDVVAVWSATSNHLLSVETSGTVTLVNSMGQPIAPDRTSNGTVLTLQAGFPVYVQGDKGFTFKPVGWIEPLKLTDSHLHPGEQTIIHVEPDAKVHDWIVPPGWNAPQPRTDGTYELTVPRTAAPGPVDLKARVLLKGQSIVPLTLTVEPQVLGL